MLIKAGEWRLGSDEEPKPFQIVRVQKIIFHPQHQPNTLNNDIALLYLENDIKYDQHIGPICLDDADLVLSPNDNCVTTGWGKEVLKGKNLICSKKKYFAIYKKNFISSLRKCFDEANTHLCFTGSGLSVKASSFSFRIF